MRRLPLQTQETHDRRKEGPLELRRGKGQGKAKERRETANAGRP